jgi:polysaccharide deacetylase family protein (PEP-CTERM system associated)
VAQAPNRASIVNAMTIDVEDYFQVSGFDYLVKRDDWDRLESRVCRNTERLLEIFADTGTHATFFVLGWVAEKFPKLVREIHDAGHELASHGHGHRLIYSTSPAEFREDLGRSKSAIESAAGVRVAGYRAPSFSITEASMWALDVLIEEGYEFDASIYPIRHDRYGIPDSPRHVHEIERTGGRLWELPASTVRWAGVNLPLGGGGYFRQLPYFWTASGIRHLNQAEKRAAIFYLHPWEVDPDQPRLTAPLLSGLRHYRNLDKTETRLRRLLRDFTFGTVSDVLAAQVVPEYRQETTIVA